MAESKIWILMMLWDQNLIRMKLVIIFFPQSEGEVGPNEVNVDEDKELKAFMEVFYSVESESLNNDTVNSGIP